MYEARQGTGETHVNTGDMLTCHDLLGAKHLKIPDFPSQNPLAGHLE